MLERFINNGKSIDSISKMYNDSRRLFIKKEGIKDSTVFNMGSIHELSNMFEDIEDSGVNIYNSVKLPYDKCTFMYTKKIDDGIENILIYCKNTKDSIYIKIFVSANNKDLGYLGYMDDGVHYTSYANGFLQHKDNQKILDLRRDSNEYFNNMDWKEEFEELDRQYIMLLHYTLNLLQVKNCVTEDVKRSPRVIAKAKRAKKYPPVEYKVLKLELPGKRVVYLNDYVKELWSNREHMCRGHFRTYTSDSPLFGNPKCVGTYWIPAHLKGNKSKGSITKDYTLSN